VPPGGRELVPLTVEAPAEQGAYRLSIDLVHEHVRWFGSALKTDVEVRARRLLAVHGPVELDGLTELEPGLEPLVLAREPAQTRARYAGQVAQSVEHYLLDGLPSGRLGAAATLLARTARLRRSARRVRRGGRAEHASEFLEPLARAEALLLIRSGATRRERWVERATETAAKTLGLRVLLR
jgi:hypothetical protein